MILADTPAAHAPLAAGLFGGARVAKPLVEPLVEPVAKDTKDMGVTAASRRQSFSDLFRADGGHLHAA